jgi:hypothetical protein
MKIYCLIFIGLFFLFLSPPAFAGGAKWEKEVFNFSGCAGERYSLNIPGASCFINIYSNGKVVIDVIGKDWKGANVFQTISSDGRSQSFHEKHMGILAVGGSNVFCNKFAAKIASLPVAARERLANYQCN